MGLSSFLKSLVQSASTPVFDPAVFNHELASKTSWSPKAGGGANFKTKTLEVVSDNELRYKASSFGKIFGGIFILFPLIFIGISIATIINQGFNIESLLFALFPLLFIGVGIFFIKKFNTTTSFNKSTGYFYKGKKQQVKSLTVTEDAHTFKLETIKALQILPERVSGDKSSYTSYEINLIFEDGSRYKVVDHGHRKSIEQDAVVLSDFLGIPAWNKMTATTYFSKNTDTTDGYNSLEPDIAHRDNTESSYDSTSTTYSNKEVIVDELDQDYDSSKPRKM
ncbi:hypothetical protein JM84_1994 [Dokdonia sp. Hel_I_63]|uniref:hypothetical protein n=1 Tax=unclassified Dokdonia TaxID=2615033 RepID=UPI00020A6884|nr:MULTISPECIES: hypothetical protein [unclassified Dokdonia]AEE20667.1 hypothetical protein Krodi_2691 [Dokdonia sp. 4H-3-7-5]TVZ23077.1 hypothetical protein JM84_1994 [Dokdonia sp. Hel_I_63]